MQRAWRAGSAGLVDRVRSCYPWVHICRCVYIDRALLLVACVSRRKSVSSCLLRFGIDLRYMRYRLYILCVYGYLLASCFLHSSLLLCPLFESFVSLLHRACRACYVLRPNRLANNATRRSVPLSRIHTYQNTFPLLPAPYFPSSQTSPDPPLAATPSTPHTPSYAI